MAIPNNLNQNIAPLKEDIDSRVSNRMVPGSNLNLASVRAGASGTAFPFAGRLGASAHSPGLFGNLMGRERTGGGMGGGSEDMKVDPMDTNRFVEMNLNPYLTDNIHSFKHGGRMRDMYNYGGKVYDAYNYGGRIPKYAGGGATHTMPDGTVHPGATHEDYMAMMGGGNKAAAMYGDGGTYSQQANEMIAMNQIANIMGNVNSPYDNNQELPMANYGMRRKYQEGGNYPHDMFNSETGYKIVATNEGMHNKLNEAGFTHNKPKAAYGMKMKKKYTQGGRF